jgi:energy-coupling factor transporter ATP-binding protein EcfA2
MNTNETDTIVIIGETGVGKSTLANAILGKQAFKHFTGLDAGTLKADYSYGYLFNHPNNPQVRIVDTQGYNDPKGRDKEHAEQMIKLIKKFPEVRLFLLVFNGNNIRWNAATWDILSLFDKMFPEFWNNCLIVINFWCENDNDKMRRNLIGRTEGSVRDEIFENLRKRFGKNLYTIEYLDAIAYLYNDKHPEKQLLLNKIKTLQITWANMPPYYTDRVKAAQTHRDELIKDQNLEIKTLQDTLKANWKKQNEIENRNEQLKNFLMGNKRKNEEDIKEKKEIKKKTGSTKKGKLPELLDHLVKEEVKEISKNLGLPISVTKEKMIENITNKVKFPTKLLSRVPKGSLKDIFHKLRPWLDLKKVEEISSDHDSDSSDSSNESFESSSERSSESSSEKKFNPPHVKKLNILIKDELKAICVQLDLPASGNKEKLIENILNKVKVFKKILNYLSKDSLKDVCNRLDLTVGGNKDELIDKINSSA